MTNASDVELAGPGSFQRRVVRLVLAQRSALRWILLATSLQMLFGLAGPWLSARAIDTALPEQAPSMLGLISLMVVVASAHTSLASWVRGKLNISLAAQIETICSREILRRFLKTRFAAIQNQSFGQTNETLGAARATALAIMGVLVGSATAIPMTLGVAIALAVWFPELALVASGVCVIMAAGASAFALREARLSGACIEASGKAQNWLHVLLVSVPTLRASGATARAMSQWGRLVNASAKVGLERMYTHVGQSVVLQAFPQLLAFAVSGWLVWRVMHGTATLGQMMMANMLVANFTGSVVAVVVTLVGFQAMRPQFARINALLAAAEQTPERNVVTPLSMPARPKHAIAFEGVWFRYGEEERWVLEEHVQTFPVGEVSTLRAASGAGKTTLLRLAAGLLEPNRGRVRVLGLDPLKSSGLVTYLPQQSVLLEASIAKNLTVLSGQPLREVLRVAEQTGLDRLLAQLPMGAETIVSVRGGNLSAGQCQLVVLTAAFASGHPVILLDEATSQLDHASRSRVDWAALARGKSVIHVAHE